MGRLEETTHPLLEAVESGLRMQLEWGAPMGILEAGGLQVHVVEDVSGGHRWAVEWAHRFAPPLAEGVCAARGDAVAMAARALVAQLAPAEPGRPVRRMSRSTRRGSLDHRAS